MRTYDEALEYSKKNPTELVEFYSLHSEEITHWTGFFLNGTFEGVFDYFGHDALLHRDIHNSKTDQTEHLRFRSNGSVSKHYFSRGVLVHGEYSWFNEDSTSSYHQFLVNDKHIEELDYLLDADRDDTFYFTLALYGIDKEYTFN